jgi:hypothetical protein
MRYLSITVFWEMLDGYCDNRGACEVVGKYVMLDGYCENRGACECIKKKKKLLFNAGRLL